MYVFVIFSPGASRWSPKNSSSFAILMAEEPPPLLEYQTPDPAAVRLRSRQRTLGILYATLGACVIGASLADWLGFPGVTFAMVFVVVVAAGTLFFARRPPPGSA
jgi:hypothetical protein